MNKVEARKEAKRGRPARAAGAGERLPRMRESAEVMYAMNTFSENSLWRTYVYDNISMKACFLLLRLTTCLYTLDYIKLLLFTRIS